MNVVTTSIPFRMHPTVMVASPNGGWYHRQRTPYELYCYNRLQAWYNLRSHERRNDLERTSYEDFCGTYTFFGG